MRTCEYTEVALTGIGEFVRQAREGWQPKKMTQEQLAERTGLSVGYIGNLERGMVERPYRDTLEKLATALDVSYNELAAAAGMMDSGTEAPAEGDVETEIKRIRSLPTIDAKLDALKQLSPALYETVRDVVFALLDQARQPLDRSRTPVPAVPSQDRRHPS